MAKGFRWMACAMLAACGGMAHGVAADVQTWMESPASALWNLSDANWTPGGTWAGGVAAFGESSAKTVSIPERVSAAGLSFTAGGYFLDGPGSLALSGTAAAPAEISVADGMTANVAAAVTNEIATGRVRKTGAGTLALSGDTSLGEVAMAGGTLRLAGGLHVVTNFSHEGSAEVCLEADGGVLQTTGGNGLRSFTTARVGAGGLHLLRKGFATPTHVQRLVSGVSDGVDGGVHFHGSDLCYFYPSSAAYTGGFHFENSQWGTNPFVAVGQSENAFGAVPSEPMDSIFFHAANGRLHFGYSLDVHTNRDVRIDRDCTAGLSVQNASMTARICGRIRGPEGYDHTVRVFARTSYWSDSKAEWTGTLALSPGEGRTNRIGRLTVDAPVRIESGVTLLTCTNNVPEGSMYKNVVPLDVESGAAYTDRKGVLTVAGGELRVDEAKYVVLRQYGQVRVTGGLFTTPGEYLNGLGSPARTFVGGSGRMDVDHLRLSQAMTLGTDGAPACSVTVSTGGVLRLRRFYLDEDQKKAYPAQLNLDGGALMPKSNDGNFLGTGTWVWTNVFARVCAGGAVFDTDGFSPTVRNPLLSGAAADGGLVKRGAGVLTLVNTNGYNGATRVEAGKLVFTHADGYPGGSLEFPAATLAAQPVGTPLVTAKSIRFRDGCGVRVADADRLDLDGFGRPRTLATSETPFDAVPDVAFVASDGTTLGTGNGWGGWTVSLSSDGKSLLLSGSPGTVLILR